MKCLILPKPSNFYYGIGFLKKEPFGSRKSHLRADSQNWKEPKDPVPWKEPKIPSLVPATGIFMARMKPRLSRDSDQNESEKGKMKQWNLSGNELV